MKVIFELEKILDIRYVYGRVVYLKSKAKDYVYFFVLFICIEVELYEVLWVWLVFFI